MIPLRSEYYPIIFLLLVILLDENEKNSKANESIVFFGKLFWVLIYFSAGLFKINQNNFLTWFEPKSIQSFLFYQSQYYNLDFRIINFFYNNYFFQYLTIPLAILFELTYPIIFLKKFQNFYLILTILFHLAVALILQTFFFAHLGAIVFWFVSLKKDANKK